MHEPSYTTQERLERMSCQLPSISNAAIHYSSLHQAGSSMLTGH
jgi:hypothetical protein